jgi:hypothetical protein
LKLSNGLAAFALAGEAPLAIARAFQFHQDRSWRCVAVTYLPANPDQQQRR